VTVDREIKMLELKKEINKLAAELAGRRRIRHFEKG